MDQIIARATALINGEINCKSEFADISGSPLINTGALLNRLLESDLRKHSWTSLFCRQLNRLMNYNSFLSESFWINLTNDLSFIIEKQNGILNTDDIGNHLFRCVNLEEKLVQRELTFQQTFGKRKRLTELYRDHRTLLKQYLKNCIHFHSNIQIQGLVYDLKAFLRDSYGFTDNSSFQKIQKQLNEKLNHIVIPLDYSTRLLNNIQHEYFTYAYSLSKININVNRFIPAAVPRFDETFGRSTLMEVLGSKRWLVILGDPGSGKSSLLQWTTYIFAKAAYKKRKKIVLEKKSRHPVRLPILIRIGEFILWLEQHHQNKTLMDYISKDTWFAQTYTNDDSGFVLKELIYHGHALVLIDGLDEIVDIGRRKEIVDLVQKFIDEYVYGSDFISTADDPLFNNASEYHDEDITETQPPKHFGGNQVIVTSRFVGYHLHPLHSPFMYHYSLALMNHKEAEEFVKQWLVQVEKCVLDILTNTEIPINKELLEFMLEKRRVTVKIIFEKSSELLLSNPSLLSLICKFILQSSNEIQLKSRVQVYNCAIETALYNEICKDAHISKRLIDSLLVELATYLHLNSSSGLIDAFDLERLCYLTLQQRNISNKRAELRENVNKLINLLKSNNGIVDELGLQVFGFFHLSFQEYFVAQSLVKDSPIEDVVQRILTFAVDSRFRESIFMAIDWISWKWSFSDYDRFCDVLVTSNMRYIVPLGTLLFFDSIHHLQKLPSKSVIFTVLNALLDCPYNNIAEQYFISNLLKLSNDIIIEWIQTHLRDDKYFQTFCQCLLIALPKLPDIWERKSRAIIYFAYQELSSFHDLSPSNYFFLDRLRQFVRLNNESDNIISVQPATIFPSLDLYASDVHPLVLSVIIAVCGGVHFSYENDTVTIDFSSKYLHNNSSIIPSIIEYLTYDKVPHAAKVQALIKQYETVLDTTSPSTISMDIVDTFVALICLKGLSEPSIYQKYYGYQALFLAFDKLEKTWLYLKQPFRIIDYKYFEIENSSTIRSDVESIVKMLLPQTSPLDEERLVFSLACGAALNKLCADRSSDSFESDICFIDDVNPYLGCQPEFIHSSYVKGHQIGKKIHPMQMLQHDPRFLLTFVPQSLQKLYYYTVIHVVNEMDSLPFVIFLTQSLLSLEEINNYDPTFDLALSILQSQLKQHMLENYGVILSERFTDDQPTDYSTLINIERQRIFDSKKQENDLKLFAASICLARTLQASANQSTKRITLDSIENTEVRLAIMSLRDPVFRIFALSIVLNMKKPMVFDEDEKDKLRSMLISLLDSILPGLPLLISTLLFIRCYSAYELYPLQFQHTCEIIAQKLNATSINKHRRAQNAAFIALHQFHHLHLPPYLSEFIRETSANVSDLLQFNSTIFYRYFTHATYDVENRILLSIMYIIALAFDGQSLKMNNANNHLHTVWTLKKWKQLWKDLQTNCKIMTFKMAEWIRDYLKLSNRAAIQQIIEDILHCSAIEEKALSILECWLDYRMDECLRIFAHYAALHLLIKGSKAPILIEIITDLFKTDKQFYFIDLLVPLFKSEQIDLTMLRRILIILNENYYSSKISLQIDRKEILDLILNLELERITLKMPNSSTSISKSFLSMVNFLSNDLSCYLIEHLRIFTNEQNELQYTNNWKYIAVLVKWFIKNKVWKDEREDQLKEFFKCIFTLLLAHQSPQTQKVVLSGLSLLFKNNYSILNKHTFLIDNIITHLEKIICSRDIFSEDVLTICLLTYGNCLLRLQWLQTDYSLSDRIQNRLVNLLETSTSELIYIRAAFCLIILDKSSLTMETILHWLTNKWYLTPENKYNLFLQQTLYVQKDHLSSVNVKELVNYLDMYSTEFLDKFVLEWYNYLCSQCSDNDYTDPIPIYIDIVVELSRTNSYALVNAVRKSCFGEDNFKRKLYLYYMMKPNYSRTVLHIYAMFGVLTTDFVEMLTWINDSWTEAHWDYLKDMKQVSNREVIENLFQQLDSNGYNIDFKLFSSILRSLVQLAQAKVVSAIEVHQRVSAISHSLFHDGNFQYNYQCRHIIDPLLDLSCITKMNLNTDSAVFYSENDNGEDFERITHTLVKKSALFLRRNYFLSILQGV